MWIKICGIRDVETGQAVAAAGADALGLNFYTPSPRSVSPATAREISRRLPEGIERVGLFVNHSPENVLATACECGIQTVQLHGDETAETVARVAATFPVIRAFRVDDAGLDEVARTLDRFSAMGVRLRGVLIDAKVAGEYGGTGHTAPWELLRNEWNSAAWPPLILAGGLNPTNVADAIRIVAPWGVDVAGGVESSVACKDLSMVREFVLHARTARGPADA